MRVQYPGSGKCWDIFIRNSFEMEARGRSEAFRVRLGQAIAQEPRASPSFPSSGTSDTQLHTQRAGTNVKAASPTDRNETFPSTQAVWPSLRGTSADGQ